MNWIKRCIRIQSELIFDLAIRIVVFMEACLVVQYLGEGRCKVAVAVSSCLLNNFQLRLENNNVQKDTSVRVSAVVDLSNHST
jgi:hypothetical protein